jgi:hypothetical protein
MGQSFLTDNAQKQGCCEHQDRSAMAIAKLVHFNGCPVAESGAGYDLCQSSV